MSSLFALRAVSSAALALLLLACGSSDKPTNPPPLVPEMIRALVFTRTTEFRHDSIAAAQTFFSGLDPALGVEAELSEDATRFTDAGLSSFDVVVFANTTGDVLDEAQQAALQRFVRSGHGFVGVHAAADTEHAFPWYGSLVGASFVSHPEPSDVELFAEQPFDPSPAAFPSSFRFFDEWYDFDRNPRETASILLTIGQTQAGEGSDHPIAWYQYFEGGRSFYTGLGHASETWADARFQSHLLTGVRWAARGPGFGRAVLSRDMRSPIALGVTSVGDVYFIERTGEVRLWHARSGAVTTALRLEVDTAQNGLLGLALDPDFADSRWLYLYYSAPLGSVPADAGPPGRNLLVRYTVRADGTLDESSRLLLLEVPSERRCCHEGGALTFAADKTLWLSTGDNTNPFDSDGMASIDARSGRETFNAERTAHNPMDLRGKVLRIARDGSIPAGNAFPPTGELGRPEIYLWGVRNPYRLAADPLDGRVFFSDVGPDAAQDSPRGPRGYDEINLAKPGDFGWPHCIGEQLPYAQYDFASGVIGAPFDCGESQPPLLAYDYGTLRYPALGRGILEDGSFIGRAAIAGAVYRAPSDARFALPARFQGQLLMADWTRNTVAVVNSDDGGKLRSVERVLPTESFRRPIDFDVGPDGALYVLEYGSDFWGNNPDAQLSRIEYAAFGKLSPVARIAASALHGPAGQSIHFSGAASRAQTPRETLLDYAWDFDGDGRSDAHGVEVDHRFTLSGGFPVSLRVTSSSGLTSLPVSEAIVIGNSPPSVRILAPPPGTRLARGAVVELSGEATIQKTEQRRAPSSFGT
ncbi:MAG: ThuA domain-containing protein [Polyangiaceae bacterium]